MFRLILIPAVLIALLAGTMWLSGGVAHKKADFTFVIQEEVHSLDPVVLSYSQDFRVACSMWEGLYRLDPKTFAAVPGTADVIDVNPNKTLYTFHLRPDVRWSNGDPVVADDFVFAWRRAMEDPHNYTYLFHYIAGAEDYEIAYQEDLKEWSKTTDPRSFSRADFTKVGIQLIDRHTLRVKLAHPVVPFPDVVAMPVMFPMNEQAMEPFLDNDVFKQSRGHIRRYDKQFTQAPNLVSNGPYYLESWSYKRRMRLHANPYYWNRQHVASQVIDQIISGDDQWGYALYQSGGADWIPDFTGEIAAELYARHSPEAHVNPAFGTYFYTFNCQPKFNDGSINPFADKRVRQALSKAIEKKVIVDEITRLGEIPTTVYIPEKAFPNYKTPAGLSYDVDAARKLLADAGYPAGKGFPTANITLMITAVGSHPPIAENIHRQWLEKLGIDVKIETVEGKTSGERQRTHDYAVCRAGWYGDYFDPSTFTDKYKPGSENNESHYLNPDYDKWCKLGDIEPEPLKRLDYYAKAETVLLDDAAIVPLYTYSECSLMRSNVYGIIPNPRMTVLLSSVGVHR